MPYTVVNELPFRHNNRWSRMNRSMSHSLRGDWERRANLANMWVYRFGATRTVNGGSWEFGERPLERHTKAFGPAVLEAWNTRSGDSVSMQTLVASKGTSCMILHISENWIQSRLHTSLLFTNLKERLYSLQLPLRPLPYPCSAISLLCQCLHMIQLCHVSSTFLYLLVIHMGSLLHLWSYIGMSQKYNGRAMPEM